VIFGQTIFQSVLERLEAEDAARELEDLPTPTVRGLKTGFVARDLSSDIATKSSDDYSHLHSAYFAYPLDDETFATTRVPQQDPPPKPPVPVHLERLRLAQVAEDLDLAATDTIETLARKRRMFAQDNHPDRVPEEWRQKANTRMKLANLLIDQAQKLLAG
jgi:hypothetical protein